MITLSMTEAARLASLNGGEFTQGALGIVNIPHPGELSVAGVTLIPTFDGAASLAFYYLSAALLGMGLLAVWRLSTSRSGWVFRPLRQNVALAAKPTLLLLDEPFTGMNPDETDGAVTMVKGCAIEG